MPLAGLLGTDQPGAMCQPVLDDAGKILQATLDLQQRARDAADQQAAEHDQDGGAHSDC